MHVTRDDKTRMYLYRAELFDKDRGCVKYSFSPHKLKNILSLIYMYIELCRVECVCRSLLSISYSYQRHWIISFPMRSSCKRVKEDTRSKKD